MTHPNDDLTWFKLYRCRGIGPKRLHAIYNATRDSATPLQDIFVLPWLELRSRYPRLDEKVFERLQSLDTVDAELEFERLQERGVTVVHIGAADYPELVLNRMGDNAPPLLFCLGNVRLLSAPGVAVVGSRNASLAGLKTAAHLASDLALAGMNVVSGYAGGTDTQAHVGALDREGTTTLVLSFGILDFAPKKSLAYVDWKHSALALSQFHPRERWSARNAMLRNRLVCALSQAVIVVESDIHRPGKMSGTFDAGLQALQMRIPLFVLKPDPILGESLGSSELIRRGGIAVRPDNAVAALLSHQNVRCTPDEHWEVGTQQLLLFPADG